MPDCNPNEHPERWLLGACSSGDPTRWAVVAVEQKVQRQAAELDAALARIAELETALKNVREVANRPEAPDTQWPRSESHLVDEINAALDAVPAVETTSGEACPSMDCNGGFTHTH